VVTHYGAYFEDPAAELRRVFRSVGLEPTAEALGRCGEAVKAGLRHARYTTRHLEDLGAPEHVLALYRSLTAEAGYVDPAATDLQAGSLEAEVRRHLGCLRLAETDRAAHRRKNGRRVAEIGRAHV